MTEDKRRNPNGCVGCLFFADMNGEKVCNEERQPKGSDGYLFLTGWDKPNDCSLRQEIEIE